MKIIFQIPKLFSRNFLKWKIYPGQRSSINIRSSTFSSHIFHFKLIDFIHLEIVDRPSATYDLKVKTES